MYFPDRVKVIRKDPNPANMDPYGKRLTLTEVEIRCRIDETSKVVKDQQGEEVISSTQFYFPGSINVAYWDELQWTDAGGATVSKTPIAVELFRDGVGNRRLLVVSC